MKKPISQRISEALALVQREQQSPGHFGLLPDIEKVLEQMENSARADVATREKIAGGLGRLVTDSIAFAESALGTELLQLADDFAAQ